MDTLYYLAVDLLFQISFRSSIADQDRQSCGLPLVLLREIVFPAYYAGHALVLTMHRSHFSNRYELGPPRPRLSESLEVVSLSTSLGRQTMSHAM